MPVLQNNTQAKLIRLGERASRSKWLRNIQDLSGRQGSGECYSIGSRDGTWVNVAVIAGDAVDRVVNSHRVLSRVWG
jgi:hypothetical protein